MTTLRLAAASLGITGDFSVMKDFMGFWSTRVPQMPGLAPTTISLRHHFAQLRGLRVDILWANLRTLTQAEKDLEDAAIHFTRALYATVNITIGRVQPALAPGASAFLVLDSESEEEALLEEFSGPDGPIDAFVVDSYGFSAVGLSPVDGDCDKQNRSGDDGLTVGFSAQSIGGEGTAGEKFGKVFAHELGHFLGLDHPCGEVGDCDDDEDCEFPNANVMMQGSCAKTLVRDVSLTAGQGEDMREHCSVHLGLIPF